MINSNARRYWSQAAEEYFRVADTEFGWVYFLKPYILNRTRIARGKRILDVGCGNGRVARLLSAHAQSMVGVDWSPDVIELVRVSTPELVVHVDDAAVLATVASGQIDLVLAINVLQDQEALSSAMAAIARVLAPGGQLVAVIEHPMRTAFVETATDPSMIDPTLLCDGRAYSCEFSYQSHFLGRDFPILGWHRPLERYLAELRANHLRIVDLTELFLDRSSVEVEVIAEASEKGMLCEPPFLAFIASKDL